MTHAFREMWLVIMNHYSTNSRTEMKPLLEELASEYMKTGYNATRLSQSAVDAEPSPEPAPVTVPDAFMRCADRIIQLHSSSHSGRSRTRIAFEVMSSGPSGVKVDVVPTADRWHEMFIYFVSRAHAPDADDGGTNPERLELELQFLEETLLSFAQPAIPVLDDLDKILASANS